MTDKMHQHAAHKGFTLVEVLIAMSILATVVVSLMVMMGTQARTLSEIEAKTFAGIVAENVLAETMASNRPIEIKVSQGEEELVGREWSWVQTVSRNDELPFLEVSVEVTRSGQSQVMAKRIAIRQEEGGRANVLPR